jgi:hypothetical protein
MALCQVILNVVDGKSYRCDEPLETRIHFHVWARTKVGGYFVGDYTYLGICDDPDPTRAAAQRAEHQQKLDARALLVAERYPDVEWIPMSSDVFNRPPAPLKTAEQIAREADEARFAQLQAKGWTALTLVEQQEATNLGFKLGRTVPPISAIT